MKLLRTLLTTALQYALIANMFAIIEMQRRVAIIDDAERRKKVRPTPHSPPAWGEEPMA